MALLSKIYRKEGFRTIEVVAQNTAPALLILKLNINPYK
jgi:hypothetical protein